jgi:hypothetical protein
MVGENKLKSKCERGFMNNQRLQRVVILLLLAMIITITPLSIFRAKAQEEDRRISTLEILPLGTPPVGERVVVSALLLTDRGAGNPNKRIGFYLDGELLRYARTDEEGLARISISGIESAGVYTLDAHFDGTRAYFPSSVSTTLTVRPIELTIRTVPPLSDIPFTLDGETFTSNDEGIARLEIDRAGTFSLDATLPPDTSIDPETRITFDRWGDSAFQAKRTITLRGDETYEAGFSLAHRIGHTFFDLDDNAVDPSLISSITLKSSIGAFYTFPDGEPRWLQASRIVRRQSGLEVAQIQYSVESVIMDGSNVVNRYQQRFYVEPGDIWPVQLILYYARISAKDAILGFPIGDGINLHYPDGQIEQILFGSNYQAEIGPIARGEYRLQVFGVGGMVPLTPMVLSRDQDVELKVLSSYDIALGVALGAVLALGLLFLGRPQLLNLPKQIVTALLFRNLPTMKKSPVQEPPKVHQTTSIQSD